MGDEAELRVGAFALIRPVAEGGMGSVWEARHVRSGLQVAVKLIRTELAQTAETQAAFAREIRAAASLDHPAVVRVLDHGLLDASPDPRVVAGSPWLAMEWATLSLQQAMSWAGWDTLRPLGLGVLDALSTIHARDLCHRDLKPDNLLNVRGTWKIADFGIARLLSDADAWARYGTPLYMAPEQVLGDWRDLGPHTDLYALAATLWHVTTGGPPFSGDSAVAVATARLRREPGAYAPRISVPAGLEAWLRRGLAPEPAARFVCAAEAAEAWLALDDGPLIGDGGSAPLSQGFETFALTGVVDSVPTLQVAGGATAPAAGPRTLPREWRRPELPPVDLAVRDAGLALIRFRDPDPSGRIDERDRLWDLAANAWGGPLVVELCGEAGSGRSALATWLFRRVREQSWWPVVRLDVAFDPANAVLDLIEQLTGAAGCDRAALRKRLVRWAPGLDPEGIERVLDACRAGDRPSDPFEALQLVAAGLERGPLLVGVDTPTESAWAVIERVRQLDLPSLFVLRAAEPDPGGRADAVLDLGTLPYHELVHAISALVPMQEQTLDELASEARGSPGRMREILAAWAERGQLVPALGGFRRDGVAPQVDHTQLASVPPESRRTLACAAVLGRRVPLAAWARVCEAQRLGHPSLPELNSGGWLTVEPGGRNVRLASVDLVLALRALAEVDGNASEWRDTWAHVLVGYSQDLRRENGHEALAWARRAEAIARVDDRDAAVAAVAFTLASQLRVLGGLEEARLYYDEALRRRRALDDRRGEAETLAGIGALLHSQGELEDAERTLTEALALVEPHEEERAQILCNLGALYTDVSDFPRARECLTEAMPLFERYGNRQGHALCISNLGGIQRDLGAGEQALALYERALELYDGPEGQRLMLEVRHAAALQHVGEHEASETRLRDLHVRAVAGGYHELTALTATNLGAVHFRRGDFGRAREYFERAIASTHQRSKGKFALVYYNLGAVLRQLGELHKAMAALDAAVRISVEHGYGLIEGVARSERAVLCSQLGQHEEAILESEAAEVRIRETGALQYLEEVLWVRATSSLRLGAVDEARTALSEAIDLATRTGNDLEEPWEEVRRTVGPIA